MEIFLNKEEFAILIGVIVTIYIICSIRFMQIMCAKVSTEYPAWEKLSYLAVVIILSLTFISVFKESLILSEPTNLNDYALRGYRQIDTNNNMPDGIDAMDKTTGQFYKINNDDFHRLKNCINSQTYLIKRYDSITIFFVRFYGLLEKESIIVECKKEK